MRAWVRDLVNPIPAARREHPLAAGLLLLAAIALLAYCGVAHRIPLLGGESGTLVRAQFTAANFVDDQTPVRVGGVDVGHVTSARLEPRRNLALVTMRITNRHVVVRRDALAAIRWRTLLGGTFYIDLDPGSPSAPPLGATAIPVAHTSTQVEFDDLAQVFAHRTADGPRVFLHEMRAALADRAAVGSALRALTDSTPTIAAGLAPMRGSEPHDLRRLVAATGASAGALARDTAALRGVVTGMQGTFAVTAGHRRALGRMIELSPPALDATAQTMRRLDVTLSHLDPLVTALRPGARALAPATAAATPTMGALRTLLTDARPLLRSLGGSLTALSHAGGAGVPLMRALTPTLTRLRTQLDPWLARRDASTGLRTYEALGPTFGAIDAAASEMDGEGYWLHFPSQTDTRSIVVGGAPAQRMCDAHGVDHARCAAVLAALSRAFGGRGR